ncbi:ragulator complex protein LAMTOR3-like isoform X2 [Artemia franciscana]|uniref:Uncharacterized protein n=1 Tax=Artemia franciscana TaxID=6661 RepID=A0AA88ISA6_ARTSF|nr:hypothetical protein QYM36_000401 [Artemia franciscana]
MQFEDVKRSLSSVLDSVEGLLGVVITDRDGVNLIKATTSSCPELALKLNFLATFGMATEQASKLGVGKNKLIITSYGNYQAVQFNRSPLLVTLIAESNSNTGQLLNLEGTLNPLIENLSAVIGETRVDV